MVDQDIALPDFIFWIPSSGAPPAPFREPFFSAVARLKITCRSMTTRFLRKRNPDVCLRPMSAWAPDLRQGIEHYSSLRVYCRAEAGI